MALPWLIDLPVLFTIGLLGGAHCIGMCGGFVVLAHGAGVASRGASRTAAYLGGKTLTYVGLGLVAGAFGRLLAGVTGTQTVLSVLVGLFLVVIGLGAAGVIPERIPGISSVGPRLGSLLGRMVRSAGSAAPFAIGLVNGLLPCGLVYAALARAAGTGSVLGGAVSMAVFGAGTMPSLALTAWVGGRLGPAARQRMARLGGWLVVALGVYTLWRTWRRLSAGM